MRTPERPWSALIAEQELATRPPLTRLVIGRKRGSLVLALDEVDWIAAAGNYVELHVREQRFLHRITLSALHARLDPRHFARIHRSRIVRLDRIARVQWITNGDAHLYLEGDHRLRLSRRFREEFELRFATMFA